MRSKNSLVIIIACFLLIGFLTTACWKGGGNQPKQLGPPAQGDYFPLKVGTSWLYDAKVAVSGRTINLPMEFKVVGEEEISGVKTFIIESFANNRSTQKEFYEKNDKALICHRRIMGTSTLDLTPPEKMLEFPMQSGQKWVWNGDVKGVSCAINFEVLGEEKITTPAGTFDAYKVKLDGKMGDGSTLLSTRWFAKDIGMVKEESTMGKGKNTMNITAELKSYTIPK